MNYDIIIRGGFLIDGTAMPWVKRDVAIQKGRIAKIGVITSGKADLTINAAGMYVCPGFIDIHTHSDVGIFQDPMAECAVRQGVTTQVIGNCGDSAAPVSQKFRHINEKRFSFYGKEIAFTWSTFRQYLDALEFLTPGINIGALVGHNAVRIAAMGLDSRAPSPSEMRRMKSLIREAMRAGAFGMSTGLVYPPGCFAATDEIVDLARIVGAWHGIYSSHIRGERETIVEAVGECITIGERSGCAVQISHNNPKFGALGWGKKIQALWEQARQRGLEVTVDNDIHTDFGPPLKHALPQWTQGLSDEELAHTLEDKEKCRSLKKEILEDRTPAFGPVGLLIHNRFDRIWILRSPGEHGCEGKTIAEIAQARNEDPWNVFFNLISKHGEHAVGLFDYQDIEEIKSTISHPLAMFCSDGWVLPKESMSSENPPYMPCSYGEFPGILERFVVRDHVLTLEEAIRKMTSMPAAKLGLQDRGILREGFAADITVIDLPRVKDRATNLFPHENPHENYPHRYPEGIEHVIVNGVAAVYNGACTHKRAGQVLKRA